ncbi:MAG: hypothetical protein CMO54_00090 [Verrucomicrobiales bacterium]|nr:hypothetical protein [Verrucomicrobiales bacterium]
MAHKTDNWKDALLKVREGLKESNVPVEKTEDELISEEIDGLLNDFEETPVEITEVSDKEIGAMKKLSKDMQAVLKGYQKIMGMGDKELKDRKYNDNYEAILDARNKVLTLIGTLTTKQQLESVDVETEEEVDVEKLSEKNMLGRLAKSMSLNEENKQKLFDYFESGELEQ